MNRIFCLMGKSASGKDKLFKALLTDETLNLKKVVSYTTRPIREKEKDGREYFFVGEDDFLRMKEKGLVIEERHYETRLGRWYYFTADDGQIDLTENSYLIIGTLESYLSLCRYFGNDAVVPVYVETEDGERLIRAIEREKKQPVPRYEEMCRRFLADAEDFSEEKLAAAGISKRFANPDGALESCEAQIAAYIKERIGDHG